MLSVTFWFWCCFPKLFVKTNNKTKVYILKTFQRLEKAEVYLRNDIIFVKKYLKVIFKEKKHKLNVLPDYRKFENKKQIK